MATILSVSITSCNWDDDESYDNLWVGFGLIEEDSISNYFTVVMDDGEILFPENQADIEANFMDNDRVLTNFTILGSRENDNKEEQYNVRIITMREILYKSILEITPEIEDSIGNDPIEVKKHWLKNNMLNFELQYYGGNKTHFINLVKQPGEINIDNGPVLLELRHNNNNDAAKNHHAAVVSFDMNSLKIPGKNSTPYKIVAKDFNNETFEYIGEYKY